MSDAINGQFDESVKVLLGIGVPLVLVFTKVDLITGGNDYERASATAYEQHRRSLFGNVPVEIVSTQPKFRELIEKLVITTDGVILDHSQASSEAQRTQPRINHVALAWSVSQRASRDINVQAAIEVGRSRYWRGLWSSDDFAGQILADCVEVIHTDVVGVWNFPDKDGYLSSKPFRNDISNLLQDLSGPLVSTPSRSKSDSTPRTEASWLNNRYDNGYENICLVVGYIVDLILILCGVLRSHGNVSQSEVQSAMVNFAGSLKADIHTEIRRFLKTVPKFKYHDNDVVMAKIIDLIKQNCDSPSGNART